MAAKQGDTVKVHYTGKLEDGTVFDSSKDRDPLEFTIGSGSIIPGFENGVIGMSVGESKTVEIAPDDGYGQRRDDLTVTVEKERLPENINVEVGQALRMERENGRTIDVVVSEIKEDEVTLDANHPLAGKKLIFDIELVEGG